MLITEFIPDIYKGRWITYNINMKDSKSILKSKLFWLGIVEVGVGVLQYIQGELSTGGTITSMGVLTVLLRLVTNKAVSLK